MTLHDVFINTLYCCKIHYHLKEKKIKTAQHIRHNSRIESWAFWPVVLVPILSTRWCEVSIYSVNWKTTRRTRDVGRRSKLQGASSRTACSRSWTATPCRHRPGEPRETQHPKTVIFARGAVWMIYQRSDGSRSASLTS